MLQFVLGSITTVIAGLAVKKYVLDNEENKEKISDTIERGIEYLDELEVKTDEFFDKVDNYIDSKDKE